MTIQEWKAAHTRSEITQTVLFIVLFILLGCGGILMAFIDSLRGH
jgi:hypothetical protein